MRPDSAFHLYTLIGQSNMAGRGRVGPLDTEIHPRVYALDRAGRWVPADDPIHAFFPWRRTQAGPMKNPRLAAPRLATDAAGRVWLAVRSPRLGTRVGVGTATSVEV